MLTFADGAAAHTISSLRAACTLLAAASGGVSSISVSGLLPDTDDPKLSILAVAQRLAADYDLSVVVSVESRRFVVQFKRGASHGPSATPEGG
jgi:hypothetical protein